MRKKSFNLTELIIVLFIFVILFCFFIPIGFIRCTMRKERIDYETFSTKHPTVFVNKTEYVQVLDRCPEGTYPVSAIDKELAFNLSNELRLVSRGEISLDNTVYLKNWLANRKKTNE